MLLWSETMSTDDDDDDYERIVTMLDSVSIARSYEFLCLNYHAPLHTTSTGSFASSPSCRVKRLPSRLCADSPVVLGRHANCIAHKVFTKKRSWVS